jgi:hypothetical protein
LHKIGHLGVFLILLLLCTSWKWIWLGGGTSIWLEESLSWWFIGSPISSWVDEWGSFYPDVWSNFFIGNILLFV